MVDRLVDDLMRDQKQAHWGTTQGDAWSLLALTEYARQVEGQLQPAEGQLKWGGQSVSFHLDDRTNIFTQTLATTNLAGAGLTLINTTTNRLYTSVLVEARPPVAQQPRQDQGFGLQRRYERLDDDNHPRDARRPARRGSCAGHTGPGRPRSGPLRRGGRRPAIHPGSGES